MKSLVKVANENLTMFKISNKYLNPSKTWKNSIKKISLITIKKKLNEIKPPLWRTLGLNSKFGRSKVSLNSDKNYISNISPKPGVTLTHTLNNGTISVFTQ